MRLLRAAAVRCVRSCIGVKDDFYNRQIKGPVMRAVMEAFRANGQRNNLVNSAIIELVNFIATVRRDSGAVVRPSH